MLESHSMALKTGILA